MRERQDAAPDDLGLVTRQEGAQRGVDAQEAAVEVDERDRHQRALEALLQARVGVGARLPDGPVVRARWRETLDMTETTGDGRFLDFIDHPGASA